MIIGRALEFVFALVRKERNAEPSDGAPLPSRDKRKPAAVMLATGLQRQSGWPDDLTTWHIAPPRRRSILEQSTNRHFAAGETHAF
jgi:hypothetical protein